MSLRKQGFMTQSGTSSPRPASASSIQSSSSSRSNRSNKYIQDHGPRLGEDVCISEEVKVSINLAIHRFRMNEGQKELEFPSSLTATERAYVHRLCDTLNLTHKSRGNHNNRYLTITKKSNTAQLGSKAATFQLVRNSRQQILSMLQRFPVTNKERLELLPRQDRAQSNEVNKELLRTATGRLNNGVPQVPPPRGESDLNPFRETLPINRHRESILQGIANNRVILVAGETGSGKTTQVPQMILDECHKNNKPCRIFCTQPRRIAALTIADRVALERGEKIGQTVGFQIRLESRVSPKTLLTFCTNGVLLRTLMGCDTALNTVTHVIVDEVHERDKFSDFLLISLKDLLQRKANLKVILMSAAMNIELFVNYFNDCPVVSVPGTLFPVEEYFLENVLKWTGYWSKTMQEFISKETKKAQQRETLKHMCWDTPQWMDKMGIRDEEEDMEEAGGTWVEREDLPSALANLGQEKEELDPWVIREMDQLLNDLWLTGNEELFPQIFHLVASENVSVDYQHSETSISPLMLAAGRGFTSVVEEILDMGANVSLTASNEWTAIDWARKFKQDKIVDILETHMLTVERKASTAAVSDTALVSGEGSELDEREKELLNIYQHSWDDDKVDVDLVVTLLLKIVTTQPEGAVLIFLPGYDDIVAVRNKINEERAFENIRYVLYQLHSSMQSSDQKKVFRALPPGVRKLILATNIAETSVTINDVVHVIDCGKVKEKSFDAILSVTMLKRNWISKASATQRKGRAGRVRAGVCYHLFSKYRYMTGMTDYATPELLRCPLQEICLQTKLLAGPSETIAVFLAKAAEPPPFMVTRSAVSLLKQMDALDLFEDLTELGRHLADLPVDPHLGKMVLNSIVLKCLDPVLTIVCSLSYKDPFLLPQQPYQKRQVKKIKHDFSADTSSDHMTLLRAFQSWQKARTDGWERSFCEKNFISAACMEMIVGMRAQLLGQLRASGFVRARGGGDIRDLNTNSENWAVVKAALCAGAFPNLIQINKQKRKLITQNQERVSFHMGSVLHCAKGRVNVPSDWVFYEEKTSIHQVSFLQCCTAVSSATVAIFGGTAKLPPDALKDGAVDIGMEGENLYAEDTSDSENEDKEDSKASLLQIAEWLTFKVDYEAANLAMQLRQKWHCLFLRRMRAPSKPWSQIDEAVIRAVVNVLTNEEQALGLQQPAGIGQRPRPMSAESIMSSGSVGNFQTSTEECMDASRQRFSTSAKKATSSPQKQREFMSPKMGGCDSAGQEGSPGGQQGSGGSNTPCSSPQIGYGGPDLDHGQNVTGPNRYFIMKCRSQNNIDASFSKGTWGTGHHGNEKKLNKAFQDGKNIYLIFSVQGSGHFQGYGRMCSPTNDKPVHGQYFVNVEWLKRANVPFQYTHNLLNPWNGGNKVQMSGDGQELEPSVGDALLRLWDRFPDINSASTGQTSDRQGGNNSQKPSLLGHGPFNQGQSPRRSAGKVKQAGSYDNMASGFTQGQGHGYHNMSHDQGYSNQGPHSQRGQQPRAGGEHYQQRQSNYQGQQGHYLSNKQGQGYSGAGQGYGTGGDGQRFSKEGVHQGMHYHGLGSGSGGNNVMVGHNMAGEEAANHSASPVMILQRGSNQSGFHHGGHQFNPK